MVKKFFKKKYIISLLFIIVFLGCSGQKTTIKIPKPESEPEALPMQGEPLGVAGIRFDVTGDGHDDLCSSKMFGSGMVQVITYVYDEYNDEEYVLNSFTSKDEYGYDYSVLGVEDDTILVAEQRFYPAATATKFGTLAIENEKLIFVPFEEDSPMIEKAKKVCETKEKTYFKLFDIEESGQVTLDYFWRDLDRDNSLEDIEKEIGEHTGMDGGKYVWNLEGGAKAKVKFSDDNQIIEWIFFEGVDGYSSLVYDRVSHTAAKDSKGEE